MRWCAALAVVLVALVVVTVKSLRRPPKRPPPAAAEIADLAALVPSAPGSPPASPAARRDRDPDADAAGTAHLRGRVLFPAGVEAHVDVDVDVVVVDATHRLNARVSADHHFDLHLPAGRYTLSASAGVLVGTVADVLVRGGAPRDVDIRLAAGAAISGRLRATGTVVVSAAETGSDADSGVAQVEDDHFSIAGLLPGRRYDVSFYGPAVRPLTLTGVTAPADGLDVELQTRATVVGAIGFPRGTTCPIDYVELQANGTTMADAGDEVSARVLPDCRFKLTVPEGAPVVTVVATGAGWHLEEQVAIPAAGDPPPICLNPPCRSDPGEGLARVRLTMEGPPAEIVAGLWTTDGARPGLRHRECRGPDGRCDIDMLAPGTTVSIHARSDDCRTDPLKVMIVAGDNHVRLSCHKQRQIEGVIRRLDAFERDGILVRCPGAEHGQPVMGTHLFQLACRLDAAAVEYQIGPKGTWRSVPLASSGDPAFVEIGPL